MTDNRLIDELRYRKMATTVVWLMALLFGTAGTFEQRGSTPITPVELWKDFYPDKDDFKEKIVAEQTKDGIYAKDSYISAYVLDEGKAITTNNRSKTQSP